MASKSKDSPEVQAFVEACRQSLLAQMEKTATPGCAVAITWRWQPLWIGCFGSTDQTGAQKVTPRTLFAIQSLTKSMTIIGVLTAVQEGTLDLDLPIRAYLPDLTLDSVFDDRPQDTITLRHLLSHKAGLAHKMPDADSAAAPRPSLAEHTAEIARTPLVQPVGGAFSYSNLGYDLAGYILQEVSGEPFGRYINHRVFGPLGMVDSLLDADEVRKREHRAVGHTQDVPESGLTPPFPSCGAYCHIEDMLKYLQFHLDAGKVAGEPFLKKDILNQMYDVPFEPSGSGFGYALGIGKAYRRHRGDTIPIYVHSGDGYGFSTDLFIAPAAGLGTVILTNQQNFDMRWRGELEGLIYRHLGDPLAFI